MKKNLFLALVALVGFGSMFALCNFGNHEVDAGYVAYVYQNPIMGAKNFVSTINGPGGTGYWCWRYETLDISVTPWTIEEKFDDILAKDKLMMTAQASLVFRVDRSRVREFVENYGAMKEVNRHKPEAIIIDAYQSFIQQHFRSAIRSEVSKYNGLDAPANIPAIAVAVEHGLASKLKETPFVVESVTIGSTTPPKSVTDGVTKKVETSQAYERQSIEKEMAKQQIEIQEAQGRAAAKKAEQEAEGQRLARQQAADADLYAAKAKADADLYTRQNEAKGIELVGRAKAEAIRLQSDSIGGNYVNLKFVENIKDLKMPQTMVGSDFFNQISEMFKNLGK